MSALAYVRQDATVFSVGPYSNREDRSYNKKMTYTRVYATFCTFFRFFSCIRLCMAIWFPALYAGFPSFISPEFYSGFIICRCFLRLLCRMVSGILLLFSRMPSEPLSHFSHFHTSVWLHPLPISAYLGIKLCLSLPI